MTRTVEQLFSHSKSLIGMTKIKFYSGIFISFERERLEDYQHEYTLAILITYRRKSTFSKSSRIPRFISSSWKHYHINLLASSALWGHLGAKLFVMVTILQMMSKYIPQKT